MPHLIVEYAESLEQRVDMPALLKILEDDAVATGVMAREDIKLRAIGYRHWRLADGGNDFVHLSVRWLAGRSHEQKQAVAERLRSCLATHLPCVHSLSVEIIDMDPDGYRKRLR
ncbi:MAG: 5-carboxymethyl-2-hydroxymuconate Delta-isomerase [Pseudomonas sp.]